MDLGIDFGTTRTVVACADRGNYPTVDFTDIAGDAVGFIPSIVAEKKGELCFGFEAQAVAEDPSWTVLASFKRLLSTPDAGPAQAIAVGESRISAGELLTAFLSYVRNALLTRSNIRRSLTASRGHSRAHTGEGGAAMRAVVAVPANARSAQRLLTLDAFRRAGFDVMAMVNEPSAAGFEYTHRHRDTLSSRRDLVVVYDLGGGTFDASLVRMSGKNHEVLDTAGASRLGGDDFDAVLADLALERVGLTLDALPPRAACALLTQCRDAKERLHASSRKVTVDLEALRDTISSPCAEVTLPAAAYYDACVPLIERTMGAMAGLTARMDRDAAEGVGQAGDVAGMYVVGGASALPVVGRLLRERFGRRVHRSPHPSAAVAIGLAIAADENAGFALSDRYGRTFGVFREGAEGREITFDPIFTKSTELPARRDAAVTCTRVYRAVHNVGHFRFFECNAVDEGRPRGDMSLFGDVYFPFDPRLADRDNLASVQVERRFEQGPQIVERYSLDDHGIVDVVIQNLDSGYERSYRLDPG